MGRGEMVEGFSFSCCAKWIVVIDKRVGLSTIESRL